MTMNLKNWVCLLALPILVGVGCAKDDKFVYYSEQQENFVSQKPMIREVMGASGVSVLWVIDNSGSMGDEQQLVSDNTELFMRSFTQNRIDWRIGLISSDESEPPYIGFGANKLNWKTTDPVIEFQNAVGRLGTNGSVTEKAYTPILNALRGDSSFIVPGQPLAIIVVSDEPEQSTMSTQAFFAELTRLIGPRDLYLYVVYEGKDLGCTSTSQMYAGSRYEEFVKGGNVGRAYSICSTDFGTPLAEIGKEISQAVTRSKVFLSYRPKVETIRITYKGQVLPPGDQNQGGYWFYDYGLNAVVFYSLDFSKDLSDSVDLYYEKAGGLVAPK